MSQHRLNVYNLPQQVAERDLAGSAVVVIDVLRATTTICQALASGAREVIPYLEIEDAIAACGRGDRNEIVLGGERGGVRIEGFDLGNSPTEYTPSAVGGRRVFITTTNGTRALNHARLAAQVIIGSLMNLSAVVASIKSAPRIDILCAGTEGLETAEDILAAGGMVDRLCRLPEAEWHLNDAAAMARRDWSVIKAKARVADRSLSEQVTIAMRDAPGGRNLLDIGMDRDLVTCAQIDRLDAVPELDVHQWRITLPHGGNPPR